LKVLFKPFLLFALCAIAFAGPAQAQAPTKPVAVGETAPDFTLTDQNGRSHSLAAERGKRAVVLVFYRGYW
jgi:cytochrome oxidase Cu insertion factor (SCO1/SenC/PrrC family)